MRTGGYRATVDHARRRAVTTGDAVTGERIAVLGPFEVSVDGRPVTLTAGRLRTVLVVLALSAGEPVTVDRLARAVWGEELPRDARRTAQLYVTRLRRRLGAEAIRTVPGGYVLDVEPDRVDAVRFTRLLDAAASATGVEAERALLVEALALWRGEPFEGARSAWLDGVEASRLVDRRLAALERRIELDLTTGRGADLVTELQSLTRLYPLRERFWGHLMTALYRAGRRADALDAYQRLYRLLTDELGIEPSQPIAEIHRGVLSGEAPLDPAAASGWLALPPPRQLPAATSHFAGRSSSLARLDALLPSEVDAHPATVVIAAIAGTAGVGKTALAVRWAHRVAHRFRDGHLYVNLRGFDPSNSPMRPAEAIRGFLHALGVPAHRVPDEPSDQIGLYRSLVAGRRMLVLLDNAHDANQVRALLPGTAGSVVVVTSRNQLTGLVAHSGAHLLTLDVLTAREATRVLQARIGGERVARERRAAEEIAEHCGRLPLGLTIVAARAVAHPDFPLAALAGELRDARGRIQALAGEDAVTDARSVFAWSYRQLTADAARLFRVLALHPGPDISAPAAASLAGLPRARVRELLAELARIHMLAEHAHGRYALHDLLRAYAVELAGGCESSDQRRAAVRRALDHYLHTAHAAAYRLNPHRDHPGAPTDPAPGVSPERLGDRPALLAWLAAERAVLLACVRQAVDSGLDGHAWQLAWALGGYLARSGRWQDWMATQSAALHALERLGDRYELARAHRGLARAHRQLGRLDDAQTHLRVALRLSGELGDRGGLGYTHHVLGQLSDMRGNLLGALDHAEHALRLFRSVNDVAGQAFALNSTGWCHARLGEHRQALALCAEALSLQQRIGDPYGEATSWDSLGYVHHRLGDGQRAIACYEASLVLRRDGGERYGEAWTLIRLGDARYAQGDSGAAGEAWRLAASILDELDHPDADKARVRLDQQA
ncbi:SARP family transcriptional regulator [Phytohabitans aurantiacus]|uniref:SARP family transcriptional regulator n=1 Tax=Phytohabitans aurantiacus TaxID=3016789 RepID=A0ABQ5R9T9_9ACTN|nr:SARP family transcriptional regulator [Phytohabitans aurantiacus]